MIHAQRRSETVYNPRITELPRQDYTTKNDSLPWMAVSSCRGWHVPVQWHSASWKQLSQSPHLSVPPYKNHAALSISTSISASLQTPHTTQSPHLSVPPYKHHTQPSQSPCLSAPPYKHHTQPSQSPCLSAPPYKHHTQPSQSPCLSAPPYKHSPLSLHVYQRLPTNITHGSLNLHVYQIH